MELTERTRPGLIKGCTRLACGRCGKAARRPDAASRAGVVLAPRAGGSL